MRITKGQLLKAVEKTGKQTDHLDVDHWFEKLWENLSSFTDDAHRRSIAEEWDKRKAEMRARRLTRVEGGQE